MLWNIWESQQLLLVILTALMVLVPWSVSQPEDPTDNVPEIWGSTDVKLSKIKYTWTLSNINYCCQNINEIIKSPTFSADGCNWYMDIRPKGEDEKTKDYISLYLFSVNCNTTAAVRFSILNSKGVQTSPRTFTYKFVPPNDDGRGFSEFILQSFYLNPENNVYPDSKLTIICEINATLGMEKSSGKFAQPKRHLEEDFGLLLETEVFSDVTLIAGRKEFKSHRAVLAARSPIFKTRFEKGSEERNDILLEITDVDAETLREMLRYIYTDETPKLKNLAANLLAAAENYQLDELKSMCEKVLRANLSIENAVDLFLLGDKYHAVNLKKEAKHFIAVHASNITNTTGFKSLITTEPRLALETFKLIG